ncbi:rhomboid family intramembrane serine protease [Fulvivirga lutea]|uniref:Rhomboid family intramembrane serine protease n=1 Tax=Fulvivirga lutea TaxID=2810512 RepID=A0A974WHB0_9BACT|nr:rhomboid family intramembrane serine protease [Fulvivirga lutea]QSE98518.1 rhomboid family intramembrane serine protease [Fulvivirga lutea]
MSITLIIIIITGLISYNAFNNPTLKARLIFNPYTILRNREYHRFLSSGFIHADFIHLLFNMFVLWMFGGYVEQIFAAIYGTAGYVLYVLMYLIGIVVSDIPSFLKHKDSPYYNALGASGGVSALLFSFIVFNPTQDLCLYGLLCFPGFIWGALYIIYSVYMGKRKGDNINHDAHLYGGLFGIAFTIVAVPGVIPAFIDQLSTFSLF